MRYTSKEVCYASGAERAVEQVRANAGVRANGLDVVIIELYDVSEGDLCKAEVTDEIF